MWKNMSQCYVTCNLSRSNLENYSYVKHYHIPGQTWKRKDENMMLVGSEIKNDFPSHLKMFPIVKYHLCNQFSSVQFLSHVWLFATPWITARQASLSITNSWSSLRLTSIESVMPSNHLILCRSLLLLPPIRPIGRKKKLAPVTCGKFLWYMAD